MCVDLKALRKSAGLTQEELAVRLGITRSYLSQVESTGLQPSVPLAKSLGLALSFEWHKLFRDEPVGKSPLVREVEEWRSRLSDLVETHRCEDGGFQEGMLEAERMKTIDILDSVLEAIGSFGTTKREDV